MHTQLPPRCSGAGRASQIHRRRRAQQHLRHAILRRVLRPGVAPHANPLLAAPDPEPPMLLPQHAPFASSSTNRIARSAGAFTKNDPSCSTGAVPIATACPAASCVSSRTVAGAPLSAPSREMPRIQRQQVRVIPVMQPRRMPLRPVMRATTTGSTMISPARASTVCSRRGARLPHLQRKFAVADSRALTSHAPEAVSAIAPAYSPRGAAIRSSCASGEVNRASDPHA